MYAAVSTRPDIAFSVSILSQFMRDPASAHREAVKQLIHHLQDIKDMKLILETTNEGLEAFLHTDWTSQPHRHSISRYVVLLHESPVVWSARKQSSIALSTAETENIALISVTCEVIYLQALANEFDEPTKTPMKIHCDNQGAIKLASNNEFHARIKRINNRYHFVRTLIRNEDVVLQYIPTDENLADVFTRAPPRTRLEKLRDKMGLDCARGGVLRSESDMNESERSQ